MARANDNWERLVTATLRREDLRLTAQRPFSSLSLASVSSFSSSSSPDRVSSFNCLSSLLGDSFTYHQILQATNHLSESNLIKNGQSGDFFYGVLEGGTQVVVKKIDLTLAEKESCSISEMGIRGKHFDSVFVPLLGHCLENRNEKFLIYKYMPNRDLSSCLSIEVVSDHDKPLPWLDWIVRLRIAIRAAAALSFLHHQCIPPLIHGDIHTGSIFLDDKFEVRLGSLCDISIEEKKISQKRIPSFLRLPMGSAQGSSGKTNSRCSYDVYCFGKVLLELITGKPGFSAGNESAMQELMRSSLSCITSDNKEFVSRILDPSLIIDEHLKMQVWSVAFVAKACLSPRPSKRPQIGNVLMALEDITSPSFANGNLEPAGHSMSVDLADNIAKVLQKSAGIGKTPRETVNRTYSDNDASGNLEILEGRGNNEASNNPEFLGHPNLTLCSFEELMDATRNFRTLVGNSGLWTIYQAWLHEKSTAKEGSGSVIAVRRLHSNNMEVLDACQSQVSFLGSLSHPNVVAILGYCLREKEIFLVHEFMQHGSLENLLFSRGSYIQALSWGMRLKILIGAAQGLAYMHASRKRGLYEYFETSDILLDGSYNGRILGFGLAKDYCPQFFEEVHPCFYTNKCVNYAPENLFRSEELLTEPINTKSDVYGFGVVLVETLTGRSGKGQHPLPGLTRCNLIEFFRFHLSNTRIQLERFLDSRLEGRYPPEGARRLALLALTCLDRNPKSRPSMEEVVETLEQIESANY